jgi:hypothetical protein
VALVATNGAASSRRVRVPDALSPVEGISDCPSATRQRSNGPATERPPHPARGAARRHRRGESRHRDAAGGRTSPIAPR